jgi:hypothetical protein
MTVWLGYNGEKVDRISKTMGAEDLAELEVLLNRASAVVPMREVAGKPNDVVGMRHDVDHDLRAAVRMAEWEAERGYRATYFLLHTAWYWRKPGEEKLSGLLRDSVDRIAGLGHEIGIHNNAIVVGLATDTPPAEILRYELDLLRGLGHEVVGTAAHGDEHCYDQDGKLMFVNYEMFSEYRGPSSLPLEPVPLASFDLEYESLFLPRALYLSDSGGRWNGTAEGFPRRDGQLHMLVHPDWWDI